MMDLLFDGANNHAGNFLVRFVPVVGVATLPTPAPSGPSAGTVGAPTFQAGYRWFKAYGTENTKSVDEQHSKTDNGDLWSIAVEFFLPGDSAANRLALAEWVRYRFIVSVEDNTGLVRLFGTLRESLELTYRFQVPKDMGDRRGATLSFKGTLTSIAPILVE